jgi:hypothetical protein
MSNGPIPLISPTALQFVPEATDFQQILNDELGQLGTDHDGFDQIFNDAANLVSEAGTILDTLDGDLNAASAVVHEFDTTAPADLAATLQPAADAADTVLNDFTQSVAPTPQQGTGGGSGAGGGAGTQDCSAPAGTNTTALPAMKAGDPPKTIEIDSEYIPFHERATLRIRLGCGDPAIFSTSMTNLPVGSAGQAFTDHTRTLYFQVTPSKAGTFKAKVTEITDLGETTNYDDTYYQVTINP